MRLVILGPPGAGKGVEAERLSQRYGISHISTGEILRSAVKEGTPWGERAKGFLDRGELVPDEVMMELVRDRLGQEDCQRGFILDGFPRNLAQAKGLEAMGREMGWSLNGVIDIEASGEIILLRLSNRRACSSCGAVYNLITDPPAVDGICNRCGGRLYQREDDRPQTIKKRLSIYLKEISELQDYYRSQGILIGVEGNGDAKAVFKDIVGKLASRTEVKYG
jgi:adenylate kinase